MKVEEKDELHIAANAYGFLNRVGILSEKRHAYNGFRDGAKWQSDQDQCKEMVTIAHAADCLLSALEALPAQGIDFTPALNLFIKKIKNK